MREERLLERIRAWEKEPERRGREDPGRLAASVLSHLRRILNTRQGSVPIAADFGMPDFLEVLESYPESLREMERSIRQVIRNYEPRLRGVRVAFLPQEEDPLSLRFQVAARLSGDPKTQVVFETLVTSDGKVELMG